MLTPADVPAAVRGTRPRWYVGATEPLAYGPFIVERLDQSAPLVVGMLLEYEPGALPHVIVIALTVDGRARVRLPLVADLTVVDDELHGTVDPSATGWSATFGIRAIRWSDRQSVTPRPDPLEGDIAGYTRRVFGW